MAAGHTPAGGKLAQRAKPANDAATILTHVRDVARRKHVLMRVGRAGRMCVVDKDYLPGQA
ncbi:hypothetical protein GCM10023114_34270 [Mycolicibacterium sediminis]|uniref:Uncharacterized protein n=1 Tax=Mycolicibacterium sediminis TaxID=1286180 RepID=A0A7I7R0B8_9MYCO|nr:hypothetical protein MSEDJ_56160 [Mycolicibacterium sediminis]